MKNVQIYMRKDCQIPTRADVKRRLIGIGGDKRH